MALFYVRIILFCPNYGPYPTARVRNITCISWNEMHMGMHNRLAGRLPAVDSNVVSCWRVHRIQMLFGKPDQFTHGCILLWAKVEPRRNMPARDDENMAL